MRFDTTLSLSSSEMFSFAKKRHTGGGIMPFRGMMGTDLWHFLFIMSSGYVIYSLKQFLIRMINKMIYEWKYCLNGKMVWKFIDKFESSAMLFKKDFYTELGFHGRGIRHSHGNKFLWMIFYIHVYIKVDKMNHGEN